MIEQVIGFNQAERVNCRRPPAPEAKGAADAQEGN
jgi:hypothetical protein